MQIKELRPGGHIELRAKVKELMPLRKFLTCFKCQFRKPIEASEYKGKCPKCSAKESDIPKQGVWAQDLRSILIEDDSGTIYLDVWKDDAFKLKIEDKIHLINGFARENSTGGVNVSKGKFGQILIE